MQEHISSLQNPLIKQIRRLQQKSSERTASGLFVAEGRREVSLALSHHREFVRLVVCTDVFENDPRYPVDISGKHCPAVHVTRSVYNKLAYRSDREGVMLVGKHHRLTPEELQLPRNPLVILLEGVEKPGNLGAVLRTADAAGAHALILAGARVDPYNPNAIRSSLGCIFTVPVAECSTDEALAWITGNAGGWQAGGLRLITASVGAGMPYHRANMRQGTILAFGAEDKGLTPGWKDLAHQAVSIPMHGAIDSLNLSASVAIMAFEAVRQRDEEKDQDLGRLK